MSQGKESAQGGGSIPCFRAVLQSHEDPQKLGEKTVMGG